MGACEYFALPDAKGPTGYPGFSIVCIRGRGGSKARARCEFCHAKVHEVLCDFVLPTKGNRERTCSRRMCRDCAQHVGDDRDLCPPHARLVATMNVSPELLADPEPFAMHVVTDLVEGQLPSELSPAAASRVLRLPERDHAFKPRDYADWLEYRTERAAIFEYLGELSRDVADTCARELAGPAPRFAGAGPLFAGVR
jgi:hypothetical protein